MTANPGGTDLQTDAQADWATTARLAADLRVVFGRLRRRLREEVTPGSLSWSQTAVLGHLERQGPQTVTALARAEGVRPQSMGATVGGLEAAGLVRGTPDEADGRQTFWTLTEAAHELVLNTRAAREDWLARAMALTLSPQEQAEVARAVLLLRRLTEF